MKLQISDSCRAGRNRATTPQYYELLPLEFVMNSNGKNIMVPVTLQTITMYFISLVIIFIVVQLFEPHFPSLTIRFTVISPTPHTSTMPLGNLM